MSPRNNSRAMSKNGLSFFLRQTISDAGAVGADEGQAPRAHSIRGVSTSVAFLKNWSVQKVLQVASWKTNSVFASFYLRDVAYALDGHFSLGPFVAAGQIVGPSAHE